MRALPRPGRPGPRPAEVPHGSTALAEAVARSLFKLMAYKDEYEVARLHTETGFLERLAEEFEGDYTVHHTTSPPLLPTGKDHRGRPRKETVRPGSGCRSGCWRGSSGYGGHRVRSLRLHRRATSGAGPDRLWYEDLVADSSRTCRGRAPNPSCRIAAAAMDIRGFGPVRTRRLARSRPGSMAAVHALARSARTERGMAA